MPFGWPIIRYGRRFESQQELDTFEARHNAELAVAAMDIERQRIAASAPPQIPVHEITLQDKYDAALDRIADLEMAKHDLEQAVESLTLERDTKRTGPKQRRR